MNGPRILDVLANEQADAALDAAVKRAEEADKKLAQREAQQETPPTVEQASKELQYRTLIDIRDTMYDIRSLLKQMLDEWRS